MRRTRQVTTLAALALAGVTPGTLAETTIDERIDTEYHGVSLVQVADGFEYPWSVATLPDGGYLVTERPGRLQHVVDGEIREISGVPDVHAEGQGGLLDVVLHPDFESNGWVYLTYSVGDSDATATALARGRLEGSELVDVDKLFEQDRRSSPGRHYGSRLAWLEDGTLLMSIGDRGVEPERAQDPGDHAGTILRLNDDGSVPEDNPYVDEDEALNEIYSWGHRNVQGMIVDPATNEIWVTEHGPRGGDELNLIQGGQNYGWPAVTRGRDYGTQEQFGDSARLHDQDMVAPVYEFLPTHAPSGLAQVTGDRFPAWEGDLLAGGLRGERVRRVVLEGDDVVHEEELFLQTIGRIRDVREGPDGAIYMLNDSDDGALYRVTPAD